MTPDDMEKKVPGGNEADIGPASGGTEEEERDEFLDRCETDRSEMTPKETSDCAGAGLADEYENEEDGGS